MKSPIAILLVLGSLAASNTAFAQLLNADDLKWINECITDNKGAASDAIIRKYCICMSEKMGVGEKRSISEWEKTHARERAACDKESGWK